MAPGQGPEGDSRTEEDLGVVESLRVPDGVARAWHRAAAWFAAQPVLARLFIGLAAFDVLARGLGIVGPPITLDVREPLGVLASFLPHNLLILLPALIVIRRPGAADDTPNVVDGAIFVALAELLSHPSTALGSTIGFGPGVVVAAAVVAVQALGWIWIGRGLSTMNDVPSSTTAGWANLAAFGIVATVVVAVATFVIGPGVDVGDEELNQLWTLSTLAGLLAPLAVAYLGRAVIRGFDDERRPEMALRLGAAGVLVAAGLGFALSVVTLLALANVGFAQALTEVPGLGVLYWLATGGSISMLVVAFGLGLADAGPRRAEELVTLERR